MIVSPPFGTRELSDEPFGSVTATNATFTTDSAVGAGSQNGSGGYAGDGLGGNLFTVGADDRCIAAYDSITAALKVRHGIVQEIGIADSALNRSRSAQRIFITSFD